MGAQEPKADDTTWLRIRDLWRWRLSVAVSDSENQAKYRKEISDYLRLLQNVPVDLNELAETIQATLPFMVRQEFEVSLILDYLAAQCGDDPDLAVDLLYDVIVLSEGFHLLSDMRKNLETIFEAATGSLSTTKQKVIELVNIFVERGNSNWRPWLERMEKIPPKPYPNSSILLLDRTKFRDIILSARGESQQNFVEHTIYANPRIDRLLWCIPVFNPGQEN